MRPNFPSVWTLHRAIWEMGFGEVSSGHLQARPQEYIESSDTECMKSEVYIFHIYSVCTRGADKSLARAGRKKDRKYFRDARDFNNIETRAVKLLFLARQGAEGNSRHSDRNINLLPSWSG